MCSNVSADSTILEAFFIIKVDLIAGLSAACPKCSHSVPDTLEQHFCPPGGSIQLKLHVAKFLQALLMFFSI